MPLRTEYKTIVRGALAYTGDDIEEAIRTWDSLTWRDPVEPGDGISVRQWEGELCVRDGNLLHINSHGAPYLNPCMTMLRN